MSRTVQQIAEAIASRRAAVLAAIEQAGAVSCSQLCADMGISRRCMKSTLDMLASEGLVVWVKWQLSVVWTTVAREAEFRAINKQWSAQRRKEKIARDYAARLERREGQLHPTGEFMHRIYVANRARILELVLAAGHVGIKSSRIEAETQLGHTAVGRHLVQLREEGLIDRTPAASLTVWGAPGIAATYKPRKYVPKGKPQGRPRQYPEQASKRIEYKPAPGELTVPAHMARQVSSIFALGAMP